MRQLLFVLTIIVALTLASGGSALAADVPAGGCPVSFELHQMPGTGDGDPMHHHIGNDADQNGDGFLCMMHVGNDGNNHVHIDNNVPCDPKPERCVVVAHTM